MKNFTWLHLNGLYQGGKDPLWPGIRDRFHEDLARLHEQCGPWDLVLISGDLTRRGMREEFQETDEFLGRLWEHFRSLGFDPRLLAVPGNHDLARPDIKMPEVRALRLWDEDPEIRKEFWADAESPYRKLIDEAFANYTAWWQRQAFKTADPGILPGDFAVSIDKEDAKLGIVGLNSSFLQLTEGEHAGNPLLDVRQFHAACHGDGPKWAGQHHACLLLTHHSPICLSPDILSHLNEEISDHGRFAVHLCGSHQTVYRHLAENGTETRRIWQGRSLFAFTEAASRQYGYTLGKIEIYEHEGRLCFWPRELRVQGAQKAFAPDYSLDLTEGRHTRPETVRLLRTYKPGNRPKPESIKNPFQLAGPLPIDAPSYIYRDCDKQLATAFASQKLIAISGEFQLGKSSLLNQVIRATTHVNGAWKDCHINFESMCVHNTEYFMEEFFDTAGEHLGRNMRTWKHLATGLEKCSTAIRIDEFGCLTPELAVLLVPKLYWLASNGNRVRIVVCLPISIRDFIKELNTNELKNPKYSREWHNIFVEPFTREEVLRMLVLVPESAAEIAREHYRTIVQYSSCGPRALQCLCDRLFKAGERQQTRIEVEELIHNPDSYT
ncbi:MAG: hypothetical protein GY862_39080 [Gammaproteobacteria bacterium]|nr:hypothetical protein [Gammaproteobacteria bacterium]